MKRTRKYLTLLLAAVIFLSCIMPISSFAASGTGVAASDTLKISVGYFGGPYYVKKTYTLADIQSLPAEEYWYSNIDSMPAAVVLYAKGVTLKNLFYDAGIDVNSVQYMHFKTTDHYSDTMTSWSLTELLDSYTPRHSYTALPENFVNGQVVNLDSVKASDIQVPTMIAYLDTESGSGTNVRCISGAQFWNKKGANENNRFRLVFGQKSPDEASYGKAAKGITEIEIQLAGSQDVPQDAYFYDAVQWAYSKKIASGINSYMFNPYGITNRAQAVTFLWRSEGSPASYYDISFPDVQPNTYATEAVRWACANGITTGMSADTFGMFRDADRAQMVTFLWRAAGSPIVNSGQSFIDVTPGEYYYNAVQWAVSRGITTGTSAQTFSPNSSCTRAQVVTFLYRCKNGE